VTGENDFFVVGMEGLKKLMIIIAQSKELFIFCYFSIRILKDTAKKCRSNDLINIKLHAALMALHIAKCAHTF